MNALPRYIYKAMIMDYQKGVIHLTIDLGFNTLSRQWVMLDRVSPYIKARDYIAKHHIGQLVYVKTLKRAEDDNSVWCVELYDYRTKESINNKLLALRLAEPFGVKR